MQLKTLTLTFVNVAKAFDSIFHKSLYIAITKLGLSPPLVNYLQNYYQNSKTILFFDEELQVYRGGKGGG